MSKLDYYRRLLVPYLTGQKSQLSFWHGKPEVNPNLNPNEIGEYYMSFVYKANYAGYFDNNGIPMLDYHGKVGKQYNPIAIAQYALGCFNLYKRTAAKKYLDIFIKQVNWLVENLVKNKKGIYVWNHNFDWEYRDLLKAPWYSALAQGAGLSALVRAYVLLKDKKYLKAAELALESFKYELNEGGVTYTDSDGHIWFEETIVDPPTHILNGFMWALWGIYDYYLLTHDDSVKELFNRAVLTLHDNLKKFDLGFWSLYEQSGTKIKMIASPFYHSLHVVQLLITYKLTGDPIFLEYHKKWDNYQENKLYRFISLTWKAVFKLLHY